MSDKPRKGTRLTFTTADGLVQNASPSTVTGLRFCVEARSGGTAQLDFADLQPRSLAIDMAQGVRRLGEVGGPLGARSTILAYANTIRIFFKYLAFKAPDISTSGQVDSLHIDGFENWLKTEGKSSVHAFTLLSKIIVVFREIDANDPNRVSQSLRDRLRYTSARPFERPRPRDAYSPYVARQLRDAARADIAAMTRRIDGCLPHSLDTHAVPIVLACAVAVHEAVLEHGFLPRNDKKVGDLYRSLYSRNLPTASLLKDVYSRFYLTIYDLPPLLTLISLDTGLEIECLKSLKADCLSDESAGTVSIRYTKRRAHGATQKVIRVRDGGPTTPGGLIRAIIKMTSRARRFLQSDALFVFYHACNFHDVVRHPNLTLSHWIARHGIVDDNRQPLKLLLSRLRKTHKALWYRKTDGHMGRFAIGHTAEIAAHHYADIPSLRPLHDQAVVDGLNDAVGLGAGSRNNEDQYLDGQDVDATFNISSQDKAELAPIEAQDVWLAKCSGFYSGPFSKPGDPCSHPFWGCLDCPNAVITERKLPSILGFLDFIIQERATLGAQDWEAKFGHAHARITRQILPSFSEEVIESARAKLAAELPKTYLPPEVRQ